MSSKVAWIIVVCTWGWSTMFAQTPRFAFAPGISIADYEAGVVWVKVKPAFKDVFQQANNHGRMPSQIHALRVKPLLAQGLRNKAAARVAPRKTQVDIAQYYKLNFDKSIPLEDYVNDLYSTGYFETVEPVYIEHSFLTPNDPAIANQYYLELIKAGEAWDITKGTSSIIIGIVDSGGDLNHPDLQNNIYVDPADPTDGIDNDSDGYIDNNRGWDFSGADAALIGTSGFIGDNDPSVYSGNMFGHGTMVAGCASAATNNGVGISGVGFNTKLLFTKHYADNQPDNSTSYSSGLYEGVLYAALHGAKIINCSWGNPNASGIAQDLIRYVTLDLGCLVVAAAGNSNSESPLYPAGYDYVLSVASSDESDVRSWFSNYGKTIDIIAPGSNIYTTNYDNGYKTDSGTSLSAPIVSGAAALVWAYNPAFTPLQVAEQLRVSADETFYSNNASYLNKLGKGRLDIARALTFQSPSVRASNQVLVNNEGEPPGPGESAKLFYDFTNFLKPSSSALTVTITTVSPYVTISQNELKLGAMGTNTTVNNENHPFELTFAANLPIDLPVEALLTFSDGTYHDTQVVSFAMPLFIDVNENNITTTITSSGRIGYANSQNQNNGSGFIYNEEQLLFEMGVIMGTSSSDLFDNVRSVSGDYNQEFTTDDKIKKLTPGERSFSEVTGSFRNAESEASASLSIAYRSMVWKNAPYRNFVILEYTIKNTTTDPLTNFYMGIFADWDILSGGSSDRAAWDNDTRLGYVFPAQPSALPRAGIQALTGNPNYYAIDNDDALAGNPLGLYDGFTDSEKFMAISSGLDKIQAGNPSGNDVSQVVSVGPYSINGGEEITIAFALHSATALPDLLTSAKYADSLYNYTFTAPKPIAGNIESCQGDDAIAEATGASNFKWYTNFVGGTPIFSGPEFTIPTLDHDTLVYVSNADQSYESLRTPVSIAIKPKPVISSSGSLDLCPGENILLSANAGEEYTWNTGEKTQAIEVASTGSYTVTVRDGSLQCTSLPAQVIVHPNPFSIFTIENEASATGQELIFLNESTGATSWQWNFGDGQISDEENPTHSYAAIGNYTITLTATSDEGCVSIESKSIGIITGTEFSLEKTVKLYPNPVYDDAIIVNRSVAIDPIEINVFNSQGGLVYHQSIVAMEQESSINVSGLSSGIYQVQIITRGQSLIRKIVVAR
jgi:serine protease